MRKKETINLKMESDTYSSNINFNGKKILNINKSIRDIYDFSTYLESIHKSKNEDIFLWIRLTDITLPIFELLLPLLTSFNRYDRERFMKEGKILISWNHVVCGYPYTASKRVMFNHLPLDIVYE